MNGNPLDDSVSRQYERWIYPEPIEDLPGWLAHNWQWFDPSHAHRLFWPDRNESPKLDILIAGCGTNQAAVFAYTNPGSKVVALDVSTASLAHHQRLQERYGLHNLELHHLPIESVGHLGRRFDLIVSTGVLHHLADPTAGLQALAACLKADGVMALMVYAHYGRLGVEMLQGVFRDLGLQQVDSSLAIVRAALEVLPQDHPLRSYLSIAPDLHCDAGLVDTFLHGRDRSYTVNDCLELVASAGLVFQDWFMRSPYTPAPDPHQPFIAVVEALPQEQQWRVMERIYHRNGCHFFTACHPTRPKATYRLDWNSDQWLQAIPFFRYRCGLDGSTIVRPGWSTSLSASQMALVREVDGRCSIGDILEQVQQKPDPTHPPSEDLERFARAFFLSLVNRDVLGLGLQPAQPT